MVFLLRNLQVRGKDGLVFNELDLTIRPGEHWAILGPSGSGKTALLETLAGKLAITGGEFNGPRQQDVLMISSRHSFRNQANQHNFYYQQRFNSVDSEDGQTVREALLAVVPHRPGGSWDFQRVVDKLKLFEVLDKQLILLSNGESKRFRFAMALLKNPRVLLADMPLAGLDKAARSAFEPLLSAIAASGIQLVMAKLPGAVPDVVTHVAVLNNCRIDQAAPRGQVDLSRLVLRDDDDETLFRRCIEIAPQRSHSFRVIASLREVTVKYGDKVVLDRVSWEIKPGERWCLAGPNGSGKSTLLSLLNGDHPQAYANKIVLFDRQRGTGESIWDIKKNVGFVSAELFQYFPARSSCAHVIESGFYETLGLFRASDPAKAAIVLQWMEAMEIARFARQAFLRVPASVQRLCLLARAMVKNPPLLIFDEACQGLDSRQLAHFNRLVDLLCEETEVTVIYVSHYEEDIPVSVTKRFSLNPRPEGV